MRRRELLKAFGILPVWRVGRHSNTGLMASPLSTGGGASAASQLDPSKYDCYTNEWLRTRPDLVVYLPRKPVPTPHGWVGGGRDGDNEHFLVDFTPKGDLLAIWTQGTSESAPDNRVVFARSTDEGKSWSAPSEIDGATKGPSLTASWGFPVTSRSGRIYCFYNKNINGAIDRGPTITGAMRCKYSDDDGYTWQPGADIAMRRTRFDHPDQNIHPNWVVWQKPIRDSQGRVLVGFTRWSSRHWYKTESYGSQCELMRFDNIDEGPEPENIQITWLPKNEGTLQVARPPESKNLGGSARGGRVTFAAEEPGLANLPDGRLFMTMRTFTGRIWYSVSEDDGESWRKPEVLRNQDKGEEMLHPWSPCPLYGLKDGRFLLFYHNHDGYSYGGDGPRDHRARRPQFLALGEYRPRAYQPVWFSKPKLLFDSNGVGLGPAREVWLAMYASLTERDGHRIFWYPDRKFFLLGRHLTDALLADMSVPGSQSTQ